MARVSWHHSPSHLQVYADLGKVVPIRDPIYNPAHPERDLTDRWSLKDISARWELQRDELRTMSEKQISSRITNAGNNAYLAAKRSHEMLTASRMYFDRALDGHRKALVDLSIENIEAGKGLGCVTKKAANWVVAQFIQRPSWCLSTRCFVVVRATRTQPSQHPIPYSGFGLPKEPGSSVRHGRS